MVSRAGCVGWQPHAAGLLMSQVVQLIAFGFATILARSQGCQTHCGGRAQGARCVGLDAGSKCSPSLASPSTAEDSLHYKDLSTHISNINLDAAQYACSLPGGSRPFVGRIPQRACSMLPLRLPSGVWGADKTSLKTSSTPSY